MRRWVDKADPRPTSNLIYQAEDGQDMVLSVSLTTREAGAFIDLELFPDINHRVRLNGLEAIALGRRLVRMGERSTILGTES